VGLKYADIPIDLAAISKVPQLGRAQIFADCGFVEYSAGFSKDITEGRPGELGWKVLPSSDPAEKTKKLSAEIANGRLAMMAIIRIFVQDGLMGSPHAWADVFECANVCESPQMRAAIDIPLVSNHRPHVSPSCPAVVPSRRPAIAQ